ncbi:hypothetical protein AVEN_197113-1 [Araneus ventricosus]|uniref:Uncharacterized protein n=1 Tax=Araneus ventricosus TaxID=182803 RepID=A0A4Y2T585_ARAVE|nr:hypothetical protein AVEN_197113-1 [Araneus ventricosus]
MNIRFRKPKRGGKSCSFNIQWASHIMANFGKKVGNSLKPPSSSTLDQLGLSSIQSGEEGAVSVFKGAPDATRALFCLFFRPRETSSGLRSRATPGSLEEKPRGGWVKSDEQSFCIRRMYVMTLP